MLPYLADRRSTSTATPTGRQARVLAQGRTRPRAGVDHPLAQRGGRSRARPRSTSCSTARRARLAGQLRRHRAAPLDLDRRHAARADLGDDRHRPRPRPRFDDVVVLARLYRTALEHLGVEAAARRSPAKRDPDLGARGRGLHVRRDPGVGGARLAGHRRHRARAGELGVGEGEAPGSHPLDYTQNAINKTLVAPFSARPPPAHRSRCRSPGTSSTTPTSARPLDHPHGRRATRPGGDPLAPLIGRQQRLPAL